MRYLLFTACALWASACTHSVHLVHVSDFTPYGDGGQKLLAKTERDVILGFGKDTLYVDDAYKKMMKKCPNGQIVGITTESVTSQGFLSNTDKIYMKGRCVK